MLDNSRLVAPFAPLKNDGDKFIYTEMLNRGQKKGNNSARLVKTFYHRSQEEFWEQWPIIKEMCDMSKVRACTRLATKSFERVATVHIKMVVEAYTSKNFAGFKTLYNRSCGITPPESKLWLFDIDVISEKTKELGRFIHDEGHMIAEIPSKKGMHYIFRPFDTRLIAARVKELGITEEEASIHKDNPTNLYIPDGAD